MTYAAREVLEDCRLARDVLSEAIDWWEAELSALEFTRRGVREANTEVPESPKES